MIHERIPPCPLSRAGTRSWPESARGGCRAGQIWTASNSSGWLLPQPLFLIRGMPCCPGQRGFPRMGLSFGCQMIRASFILLHRVGSRSGGGLEIVLFAAYGVRPFWGTSTFFQVESVLGKTRLQIEIMAGAQHEKACFRRLSGARYGVPKNLFPLRVCCSVYHEPFGVRFRGSLVQIFPKKSV